MAKKNEFTHGGSVGKNLALTFRALLNLISFGALWFGISQWGVEEVMFGLPEITPTLCTFGGAGLCLLFFIVNLCGPMAHRIK